MSRYRVTVIHNKTVQSCNTRVSKTVSTLKEQTDLHDYRRSKVVYLETSVSSITMILRVFSL